MNIILGSIIILCIVQIIQCDHETTPLANYALMIFMTIISWRTAPFLYFPLKGFLKIYRGHFSVYEVRLLICQRGWSWAAVSGPWSITYFIACLLVILQSDWSVRGQYEPILPSQEGNNPASFSKQQKGFTLGISLGNPNYTIATRNIIGISPGKSPLKNHKHSNHHRK